MHIQSLTGAWQFRQAGTEEWWPATVPGGAHTDLLALGRIPDPFVGDNERRVQWVAERDHYRWEVAKLLVESENELRVFFSSPVAYVRARQKEQPLPGPSQSIPGGSYLRKAPCQFVVATVVLSKVQCYTERE